MEKAKIVEILNDWNFWGKPRETGIPRPAYVDRMERLSATGQIVTMTGVRRTGKSTLLYQYIDRLIRSGVDPSRTLYVNFEDPRWGDELSAEFLTDLWEAYLEYLEPAGKPWVFLDEAQNVPRWEKFVRMLHERKEAVLFVSGSSSQLMSAEFGKVLTGRHIALPVWPLDFREFLSFNNVASDRPIDLVRGRIRMRRLLREYLEWGGFPLVALSREKRAILGQYYSDILTKDIVERFAIRKPVMIRALARYYLTADGSPISFNRARKFLSAPLDTIERFSEYLTLPPLVFFVNKFSWSLKEQEVNPRKVYAIDTGLRNAVALRFSEDTGRLYENAVFLHLARMGYEIYYWKNGVECDFLVRRERGPLAAVQVCAGWNPEVKARETRGLLAAMERFRIGAGWIVTEGEEGRERSGRRTIRYLPLGKFLLESRFPPE